MSLAASSSLSVTLPASTGPGAVFRVLSAPRITATFGIVSAAGHQVEAIYDRAGVSVRVLP